MASCRLDVVGAVTRFISRPRYLTKVLVVRDSTFLVPTLVPGCGGGLDLNQPPQGREITSFVPSSFRQGHEAPCAKSDVNPSNFIVKNWLQLGAISICTVLPVQRDCRRTTPGTQLRQCYPLLSCCLTVCLGPYPRADRRLYLVKYVLCSSAQP